MKYINYNDKKYIIVKPICCLIPPKIAFKINPMRVLIL